MEVLTAYRYALLGAPAVVSIVSDRVFYERVDQSALRPNILLQMPESGTDYSHQGPVGLYDGHLKVICRADTFQAASQLAKAVKATLEDWRGVQFGIRVQMTEHFNSMSDYDDRAKVYLAVHEFTSFFSEE